MCYGVVHPTLRSKAELRGLDEYLRASADYILRVWKEGRLSGVVLCGGFTNPQAPELSEASSSVLRIKPYLMSRGIPEEDLKICLEEQSHNTVQNIVFTGYLILHRDPFTAEGLIKALDTDPNKANAMMDTNQKWQNLSHNIVFVCDRYRHPKVWLLLKYAKPQLADDFRLRVVSFPREDTHPNSSWVRQLVATLRYQLRPDLFFKDLKVGEG